MWPLVVGIVKRVLNSGSIKLPYIKGSEKEQLANHLPAYDGDKEALLKSAVGLLIYAPVEFTFEVKAPLLTFLALQDCLLGALKRLDELDHPIAYLPPQFYRKDDTGYTSMDGKSSNAYTTKLFNFYTAAFNFYNNLLEAGLCKEEASLVLPQGAFVNFLWTINAKDLVDYIEIHHADSPEIYGYCSTFALYLEEHTPELVKWLKQNRWQAFSL
jgi:thymidylate synthase (FAD)